MNTASEVWKQQTRFYWVYSWELMADATSLTPPSPGWVLSNKHVEPYSPQGPENVKKKKKKKKKKHYIDVWGDFLGPSHGIATAIVVSK